MGAFAGWIDFERDLTRERGTMLAMTRATGASAETLWLSPRAALNGDPPPAVADEAGAPLAALAFAGEIYNVRALREELSGRGHRFRTDHPTEVVVRGHLEWGDALLDRLDGLFAYALWDARAQELLLVRDRLGLKSLYYWPLPSGVIFGSKPRAILANPLVSRAFDAEGLRLVLGFNKAPGRTAFRGMHELDPGRILRVRRDGTTERTWWKLTARPHTDDRETTFRTVRRLLAESTTQQMLGDVPPAAMLSGGLDSSIIATLAQQSLRTHGGGPLRTFSMEFESQSRLGGFEADAMRGSRDEPFAAEMVAFLGTEHARIAVQDEELAAPETRAEVLAARDLPMTVGDYDPAVYLFTRGLREHTTVALSGNGADEAFGGYVQFLNPEMIAAPTFPWLAMLKVFFGLETLPTLLAPALLAELDLPSYIAACYEEALAEVPRLPGESPEERRMREVTYLHLSRFLHIMDGEDRMSVANGLDVRVPFLDYRLTEYVFNVPWSMKAEQLDKSLLRAAFAGELPRSVLERKKSPFPSTKDARYAVALRMRLAALLDDPDAPARRLLDVERARAVASDVSGGYEIATVTSIEQALLLDEWLRAYGVSLGL